MSTEDGGSDPVATLLAALGDVHDFGTAWATKNGAMTMPVQARKQIGLPSEANWRVFGSPELGVAIVLAPEGDPRRTLEFILRETAERRSDEPRDDDADAVAAPPASDDGQQR